MSMFNVLGIKNINESEVNEEELETTTIEEIPEEVEECPDSPVEACLRVAMETSQNWSNFIQAIALDEMAVLESTGSEMIYEEVRIKKIVETITTWLTRAWEKIQGIFKKAMAQLDKLILGNKSFIKNNKERLDKIKGVINLNESIEIYKFKILYDGSEGSNMISNANTSIDKVLKKYLDVFSPVNISDKSNEVIASSSSDYNSNKKSIWDAAENDVVQTKGDKDNFASAMYRRVLGEKEKVARINVSECKDRLEKAIDLKKNLQGWFKDMQKLLQTQIKNAKEFEKAFKKAEEDSAKLVGVRIYTDIIQKKITMLNTVLGQGIKAVYISNNQNRRILAAAMKATASSNKPESQSTKNTGVKESFLDNLELI